MSIRRAAFWSVSGQYITFAIQFAASVIISRFFLKPAEIGLFSIALAAAMVLAIFQDMGVTRFISGQPQMRRDALGDYLTLTIGIAWSVAAILILSAPWLASFYDQPGLVGLVRLIGLSYVLVPFATVSCALLIRDMDFRGLFWVNAGSGLVGNITAVVLAFQGFSAFSLAWGVIVTALIKAISAQIMRPVVPRLRPRKKEVAPLLRFGSASFLISASAAIGQRSQDLIVGFILGIFATGLFSRASALAGQLSMLVTGAINSVFYPAFARKRDAGEPLAEPYLHLMACNTALNWAAMTGLAVCAEPLVRLLYGENWTGVAPLLFWTAIGEMLFIAMPLQMDIPILLGRIRTLVWINFLETGAAVMILALACLISLEAAAISRVLYGLVWWAIYAGFLTRLIDLPVRRVAIIYMQSIVCALAAGLPMIVLLYCLGSENVGLPALLLGTGLGGLAWVAMLFLCRHPAREEIRLALNVARGSLRARRLPG